MLFWKLCNQKTFFQYARQIKPRIPIKADEVEQRFEQQKQQIKQMAEKQIQHAHTLSDLIQLYQEVNHYTDVSEPILKRLHKLKISSDEFTQNQDFLISMVNEKTFQLTLNLMKFYQNSQIESLLLKAFQQNQLEITLDNNLKILEIIAKQGNHDDLLQWVKQPEFTMNGKSLAKFYEILEQIQGQLPDRELIVNNIEKDLHKYVHKFDYETIYYILKYRSFNQNAINEELLVTIQRRVFQFELSLDQIINLNQYMMVDLQYSDQAWLNLIAKSVLKNLYENQQAIEEHKDDLQDDEIIQNDNIENKEDSQVTKDLEFEEFIKDFELRQEPFVLSDKERSFLKLMNQLSQMIILNDLNLIALSFFKELDIHMMQFYNHLTTDEQLICLRFHAKFIETLYNEQQIDPKRYRKSSKKKLEQMNNNFYQIVLQVIKELNFEQTLKLLDSASVLGVSKRKVCQRILKIGLEGLKKIENCKLENHKKNYALFAYYKLLQTFITKEDEILQIEEQFKQIKINTLDLQTEYAHLGVKRQEIQQIENQVEQLNNQN